MAALMAADERLQLINPGRPEPPITAPADVT